MELLSDGSESALVFCELCTVAVMNFVESLEEVCVEPGGLYLQE